MRAPARYGMFLGQLLDGFNVCIHRRLLSVVFSAPPRDPIALGPRGTGGSGRKVLCRALVKLPNVLIVHSSSK